MSVRSAWKGFKRFVQRGLIRLFGSEWLYALPFLAHESHKPWYALPNKYRGKGHANAERETASGKASPVQELPHQGSPLASSISTAREDQTEPSSSPFEVPPQGMWVGYGKNADEYLRSGWNDTQQMRAIARAAGSPLLPGQSVLELGCAAGRMLRWLDDLAAAGNVWGVDISATFANWCRQHLSPPFRFATVTAHPHLPFEDRTFDFIYCGSVFTHIDDLAMAWFLELRRVLRPGGKLFLTMQDEHSLELLSTRYTSHLVAKLIRRRQCQELLATDWGMFTVGRAFLSHVFYKRDYLRHMLDGAFNVLSVTEEAYGHQTAMLLERCELATR